ncbi:MAG: TetR/AcrR family transcriptional regulator [Mycobacteriaceae bacterium]
MEKVSQWGSSQQEISQSITKRRLKTRQKLLDAALHVFAEEGFGRATVEQICQHAGYTRGAFYSNFASLDELFLAMWEVQSAQLIERLRAVSSSLSEIKDDQTSVKDAFSRIINAIPMDSQWYRITAEFTAHAMRNPTLRWVMVSREEAILSALMPIIDGGLQLLGRRAADLRALAKALVAVHDGTSVQCILEPDNAEVHQARIDLFFTVVMSYSEGR